MYLRSQTKKSDFSDQLRSVTTYFKFWTTINRKMPISGEYFIKYLVFGHDFWIDVIFSYSWVINICHVLQIGTNNNQICGNILPFQSGHFDCFGHYGQNQYGLVYGHYWCQQKEQEKCRSPIKTLLKK